MSVRPAGGAALPAVATTRVRRLALGFAFPLLALVLLPVAGTGLVDLPGLLASSLTLVAAVTLLSGLMLVQRFIATGGRRYLAVAAVYLASAGLAGAHLVLVHSGLSAGGMGSPPGAATWLWVTWHLVFPVGLAVAVLVPASPTPRARRQALAGLTVCSVAGGVLLLTTLVLAGAVHGGADPGVPDLPSRLAGAGVIGVHLLALVVLVRATWSAAWLDRWLVVAVCASLADSVLSAGAGARGSLGWHLAHLLGVIAGGVVLQALIAETLGLHRRLSRSMRLLRDQMAHDGLTGLLTRRALLDEAERRRGEAVTHGLFLGVAVLDLDRFREVNERCGTAAGDEVLSAVAGRLEATVRSEDSVGRFGGAEFVLAFLTDTRENATRTCERALEALRVDAVRVGEVRVRVTASMGLVVAGPRAMPSLDDLLRRADSALRHAKGAGRDRLVTVAAEDGRTPAEPQAAPPPAAPEILTIEV